MAGRLGIHRHTACEEYWHKDRNNDIDGKVQNTEVLNDSTIWFEANSPKYMAAGTDAPDTTRPMWA